MCSGIQAILEPAEGSGSNKRPGRVEQHAHHTGKCGAS
jgi:hypothetical protein